MASADRLTPPVSYQGGKQRLAATIVDRLAIGGRHLYDLCCGSGAIALEAVSRGVHPGDITMVDAGPWGAFWQAVGSGHFRLDVLAGYLDLLGDDPAGFPKVLRELAVQPAGIDTPEVFVLLQAGSFGSKPVTIDGGRWQHHGFRTWWQPTATSSRRSPVNPMMPMPATLTARIERLCARLGGVDAIWGDATAIAPAGGAVVYLDPPYADTTGYGHHLDVEAVAVRWQQAGSDVHISEGRPLADGAVLLAGARRKGGISGARVVAHDEWLTHLPAAQRRRQSTAS